MMKNKKRLPPRKCNRKKMVYDRSAEEISDQCVSITWNKVAGG